MNRELQNARNCCYFVCVCVYFSLSVFMCLSFSCITRSCLFCAHCLHFVEREFVCCVSFNSTIIFCCCCYCRAKQHFACCSDGIVAVNFASKKKWFACKAFCFTISQQRRVIHRNVWFRLNLIKIPFELKYMTFVYIFIYYCNKYFFPFNGVL